MPVRLWGAESKSYTDYECLPPFSVDEFDAHLRDEVLENAIPWSVFPNLKVDPSSRLDFEQRVGFEFMHGLLIAAEGAEGLVERNADPLTGTRSTLKLLKMTPRQGPQELTPFIQSL